MTTVACVWVRGHVPFTSEYVTRLQSMVARWLDREHRFVCLTDQKSYLLKGVETISVPTPSPLKGWWSKVRLFDKSIGLTGRVLYLDLDTLVVGPLGPILDFPAPFALVPDAGHFAPIGRQVVKRFNSSVMVWDAGCNRRLFDDWTPTVAKQFWGDQDWIGEQMPEAATFPPAWFPRLSEVSGPPFDQNAKVILSKVPKNHVAAKTLPWFRPLWGAV